jgi:hypothetical protein
MIRGTFLSMLGRLGPPVGKAVRLNAIKAGLPRRERGFSPEPRPKEALSIMLHMGWIFQDTVSTSAF